MDSPARVISSRLSRCGTAKAGLVADPRVPVIVHVMVRSAASMSQCRWPGSPA